MNEIEERIIQEVKDSALAIVAEDVSQLTIDQRICFEQELEDIIQSYLEQEIDRKQCLKRVKALLRKYGRD
ncbi:hypothetical protein [Vibrio parahaemolyticus]|uniref:hypothetical protein n=1 Tax=Vibrio parahaemolyticus TaxID=670 RepID=UPI001110C251|nr:hypothetical protein [Vibrio parahaemolyticus]TMX40194.1 hypothetical protein DA098_05305 [Vibrio parahaemolyticus]TMX79255.1 hypothetical protein DA094_05990 [Vibrio parahaemolyticus]